MQLPSISRLAVIANLPSFPASVASLLPPEQIRPTGEETAALVDYLLNFIAKKEHL